MGGLSSLAFASMPFIAADFEAMPLGRIKEGDVALEEDAEDAAVLVGSSQQRGAQSVETEVSEILRRCSTLRLSIGEDLVGGDVKGLEIPGGLIKEPDLPSTM